MAAYCFFDVRKITDKDKAAAYRSRVFATVERYGGRYLVLGGSCDAVEGSWQPGIAVIIEFPSLAQAHRWYDSDDYNPLKALRLAATEGSAVFLEGYEPEAQANHA